MTSDNKDRVTFRTGAESRGPSPHGLIRTASPVGQADERTSLLGSDDGQLPSRTFTEEIDGESQVVAPLSSIPSAKVPGRGMCDISAVAHRRTDKEARFDIIDSEEDQAAVEVLCPGELGRLWE